MRHLVPPALAVLLVVSMGAPSGAYPRPGRNSLVTADPSGGMATGVEAYTRSFVSANGSFVAFASWSDDLVRFDATPVAMGDDIFVRDLAAGTTVIASRDSNGVQGLGVCLQGTSKNGAGSAMPQISANGRYVVFESCDINLVPGDTNLASDIFVRDMWKGTTTRVSVASDGGQTNGDSYGPSMSANGRWIAFDTNATSLGGSGQPQRYDIFVHDAATGRTARVSEEKNGTERECSSMCSPSIDATGRYVVFTLDRPNVEVRGFYSQDVYVKDLRTGTLEPVDIATTGRMAAQGSQSSEAGPAPVQLISSGGRYVIFSSLSNDLVPNDTTTGLAFDLFVRDRKLGRTYRLDVSSAGEEGGNNNDNLIAWGPQAGVLSPDGRYAAFGSAGDNFVDGDTDGDVDVFVHDLVTGATRMASVTASGGYGDCGLSSSSVDRSGVPAMSGNGRVVAFASCVLGVVKNDPRSGWVNGRSWQLYVRDQGPAQGVGGLVAAHELSVAGAPRFASTGIVRTAVGSVPSPADVPDGAGLIGASLAYRSDPSDLFVREELRSMPSVSGTPLVGGPVILYGFDLTANGTRYQVRVQRIPGPDYDPAGGASFGLFRLEGGRWKRVAGLRGGYGTTGEEVVFALPLRDIGLQDGGRLSRLRAFTALGSYSTGSTASLVTLALGKEHR